MSDMRVADKRIRCYTSGDEIKFIDVITEDDKPEFREISDGDLMVMFKDLIKDEVEIPSNLSFEVHGVDWYKAKFPGFDDEYYELMVANDKKENQ